MGRGAGQKISMTNKELREEEIEHHTCTMTARWRAEKQEMFASSCF